MFEKSIGKVTIGLDSEMTLIKYNTIELLFFLFLTIEMKKLVSQFLFVYIALFIVQNNMSDIIPCFSKQKIEKSSTSESEESQSEETEKNLEKEFLGIEIIPFVLVPISNITKVSYSFNLNLVSEVKYNILTPPPDFIV